ncbi:thiol:disulfide interchange protein DsbG [Klebsiella quasipneumoniae]|nr:thiol:disulfide interchange protein DsbG [Klebsiella quasipneumoniae]
MLKRLLLLSLLPFCSYAEELPAPVKAIEKQGITIIKPFDAPGGMKGWLGKYQDMGVAIYLTPDGKHAISGYMYDENGNNLSEQLFQKELYTPAGQEM